LGALRRRHGDVEKKLLDETNGVLKKKRRELCRGELSCAGDLPLHLTFS
jgi:hypothetical protein